MSINPINNVTQGSEARKKLMDGVRLAVQAIRPTYGPMGLNAVVENDLYPYHQVANDAQTIIQAIQTDDEVERRGLGFVKELMDRQNAFSGDGRKTTAIMAEEILKSNSSGMELKRKLDDFIPVIESFINEQKQTITEEEVYKVATIAGESKEIGETIGKIYKEIGKDGIIHVEGSNTYSSSVSFFNGVRLTGAGYLSPFMAHDDAAVKDGRKENRAVYENPTILVTKRKIAHLNDINPLVETLTKQGKKDLVIFADDMDSGVASVLVKAHREKLLNVLIIKAPILWKQYVFEDFAKITGATIVEDATGVNFKNLKLEHLGTCGKIVTDKDETVVTGIADISDHIAQLKADDTTDSKLRLSWLTTKTAILKVGANSESELSYKRLKCEDAINASRLALMDGVVKGGGSCLYDVAQKLTVDDTTQILVEALCAPMRQNLANMGITEPNWSSDVIDSATVIKQAVRNAISLASTILTTGLVVTFPVKREGEIHSASINGKVLNF